MSGHFMQFIYIVIGKYLMCINSHNYTIIDLAIGVAIIVQQTKNVELTEPVQHFEVKHIVVVNGICVCISL